MDEEKMSASPTADELGKIQFIGNTLGVLFAREPNDEDVKDMYELLAGLDAAQASAEWPYVPQDKAYDSLRMMVDALTEGIGDAKDEDAADVDDGILWEYRRLFVGPAAKAAPPWGSVYTDKEQVIFGLSTLDLRQWMREKGIRANAPEGDPEDHIGLMLIMMAWIANNKPELMNEFLSLHLLPWAGHFLEVLDDATDHPFYHGLARLTADSLKGIQDDLGLEVETPRFYR